MELTKVMELLKANPEKECNLRIVLKDDTTEKVIGASGKYSDITREYSPDNKEQAIFSVKDLENPEEIQDCIYNIEEIWEIELLEW